MNFCTDSSQTLFPTLDRNYLFSRVLLRYLEKFYKGYASMQICSKLLIEKMFYYKFFCQTIQCPKKEGGRIPPPSDVSPTEKHADVTRVNYKCPFLHMVRVKISKKERYFHTNDFLWDFQKFRRERGPMGNIFFNHGQKYLAPTYR